VYPCQACRVGPAQAVNHPVIVAAAAAADFAADQRMLISLLTIGLLARKIREDIGGQAFVWGSGSADCDEWEEEEEEEREEGEEVW
jgi:IMP dehydrogenase/GMP reductase